MMFRLALFVVAWIAIVAYASEPAHAAAASIDELIAGAKREGTVSFYAPTTVTPAGAKELAQAFNRKFGMNIEVNYFPSGSMTGDVGRLVSQAATGVPPEWDLMVIIDALHGPLWQRKLHVPYDYRALGVEPRTIHYDSGTVSIANQIVLPAYNPKTLSDKDAPKSWEDLLDPKWKGKIGVPTATGQIDFLAISWGEEKFMNFVRALAKQDPIPGKLAELVTRLEIGEILLTSTLTDSFIHRTKATGSSLAHAQIQPVVSPAYHAGVLKGSRHPNAAHLFAVFLTSLEAQKIWERYGGQSSAFVPGTAMHRYVQGKSVIYLSQKDVGLVNKMVAEIGKTLGFRH
jgi:iron(III) transport system substrate-binding protein